MPEVAVILVVALLVLGPKRLPEVARALGKGLAEFRRMTSEVNRELRIARDLIEAEARDHDAQRRAAQKERAQREHVERTASTTDTAAPPPLEDPATAAIESTPTGPVTTGDSVTAPASASPPRETVKA